MASDEPRPEDNLDHNETSEGEQDAPAESEQSPGEQASAPAPAPEKPGPITDRVFDLVANNLGAERSEIAREQTFIGDLSADSLDIVELIMELEEEFDLEIPEDQAEKIETVGQAIDYIESATA